MAYVKHLLVAVDQLANALLGGWPDETLSSRAWRRHAAGRGSWLCRVIDRLFFWDAEARGGLLVGHCQLSYESERQGRQLPPELRGGVK
ncbi:pseudouridine synthase [uncultured Desulfovibrio sp.]|uniref:pseudouridine synthase n=1 Tax=uncultured Desulfovibrio sp. TaxID=167968 RepID=UPI00263249A2|nr:pseudouridine synthase [uncultured Desulfovibrio sp.]